MRINKIQLRIAIVITLLVAGFAGGVMWPLNNQTHKLRSKIEVAEKELGIAWDRTDILTSLAKEVDQLQKQVNSVNKVISSPDGMANVLRELSIQTEDEQLSEQGISTETVITHPDYLAMPIQLSFSGHSLSAFGFIKRVEQMSNMVQIEELTMLADPANPQEVKTTLKVNAFFTLAEETRP